MGTEVLRPYDVLAGDRFRVPPPMFQRRRNFPGNGNLPILIVNRRPIYTGYRKTSPRPEKKKFNVPTEKKSPRRKEDGAVAAVGRQVTILRRGESLDSLTSKTKGGNSKVVNSPRQTPNDDLALCSTDRIGPDSPVMVPKQIRLSPPDVYAGSACALSPSPRSVPLPTFFNNKQQQQQQEIDSESKPFDNSATRDLRRLLRLD